VQNNLTNELLPMATIVVDEPDVTSIALPAERRWRE
jgi:hypothetical protein